MGKNNSVKYTICILEEVKNAIAYFGMLQPHELAAAMGLSKGYKFSGNRTEVVKQIGNAVPVNLA